MKSKNTIKSIFSIFIIFALILDVQQAFAYGYAIDDGPVVKIAHSTLNTHDDLEVQKAFHKEYPARKRTRKASAVPQ